MYAIVETGGKQYKVAEGDVLYVEKLSTEAGSNVELTGVLAVSNNDDLRFGAPYVDGASVTAKILDHGKQKKIIIFKYRPKKGSKSKQGHRQPYTKIQIEKINA